MNDRAAFHVHRDQAHLLFYSKIISRQFSNAKAKRPILENEEGRAVVVYELANVSTLVIERAKALEVFIIAIHFVADCHADPCDTITSIVNVQVHDKLLGLCVVENLW